MGWRELSVRNIDLASQRDVAEVTGFLAQFDLDYENTVEYTAVFYQDDTIVATGSIDQGVLRNIAIHPAFQGRGIASAVLSHLMQEASRKEYFHYFIYTKPEIAKLFLNLGFKEIASVHPYVTLLEGGAGSIARYSNQLSELVKELPQGSRAAIVVNCNPFTLGHNEIVAKASKENAAVIVMVVKEDKSLFPFSIRLRLVEEGLKKYSNVLVIPVEKYIISNATFPNYFTKGTANILAQTRLDATIFGKYIAPALQITHRYIGSEPYCQITAAYNNAILDVLPKNGIEVKEVPRFLVDGKAVSASQVRAYIKEGNWGFIERLVPKTTYDFLRSKEAEIINKRIEASNSRH